MDDRDALSAGLPARRDDEPDGLRDDIVDELADHLACSYRRELLRGAEPATARRRVLERFGDPAEVAHRLWLDAMRGRIMSQRILVVCCVLLTVVSLAMAFLMWNQAEHSRRMVEMERVVAERARYEAEIARKKMLEQLAAIAKANDRPQSSGWTPVTFKLTQETVDGPPAAGFHVALGRGSGGSTGPEAIRRDSDEKGIVDFGVVQPGDWHFTLQRDPGPGKYWSAEGILNVKLESIVKTIVCPKVPADDLEVKYQIIKLKDLNDQDLKIVAGFEHQGFTFQPPMQWRLQSYVYTQGMSYVAPSTYLVGEAAGDGIMLRAPFQVKFWAFLDGSTSGKEHPEPRKSPAAVSSPHIFVDVLDPKSVDVRKPGVKGWMPGTYRMTQLAIVRASKYQKAPISGQRLDVMGYAFSQNKRIVVSKHPTPPDYLSRQQFQSPYYGEIQLDSPPDIDKLLPEDQRLFKAESSRPNEWTIHIPDELVRTVRDRLRAEVSTKE